MVYTIVNDQYIVGGKYGCIETALEWRQLIKCQSGQVDDALRWVALQSLNEQQYNNIQHTKLSPTHTHTDSVLQCWPKGTGVVIKLGSLCANRERDSEQRDESMFTYKRTASFEVRTIGLLSARDKTCILFVLFRLILRGQKVFYKIDCSEKGSYRSPTIFDTYQVHIIIRML